MGVCEQNGLPLHHFTLDRTADARRAVDRWQQDDLDDFLAHLATERTNQRSGAQGLDSISVRGYGER